MSSINQRLWITAERILPWFMLVFLVFFTFAYFISRPYCGLLINQYKTITTVDRPSADGSGLQPGDVIRRVGSLTPADLEKDLRINYFGNYKVGDSVEFVVEREGQIKNILYTFPGYSDEELFDRLSSQWFIPYIFWLAGTVSLLFLRPRSVQRLLLALFCFITAAWVSASNFSGINLMYGALLLRSEIWLAVPVYLHLHWLFPTPLRRLPKWVWGLLYLSGGVMAVVSWLQWVPANAYYIGFIIGAVGSIILLVVHSITQPGERRLLSGLGWVVLIVFLPVLVIVIAAAVKISFSFPGVVVLGLASLPGFYFLTLYRRQLTASQTKRAAYLVGVYLVAILSGLLFCIVLALIAQTPAVYRYINNLNMIAVLIVVVIGLVNFMPFLVLPALADDYVTLDVGGEKLSFSANRTAAGVFWVMIETVVVLLLLLLLRQMKVPLLFNVSTVALSALSGAVALLGYQPFSRVFDRIVLGVNLTPETLAKTYSGRITTSLDFASLRQLLLDEALPSLLVRQFVQIKIQGGQLKAMITLHISADMLPAPEDETTLDLLAGAYLDPQNESDLPGWIRLVIPLKVANKKYGYWLLGKCDPDDYYNEEEIGTLQALADQTALAMVNIEQSDALKALYYADIDRNETERIHLAAELHDDVLNQLAVLNTNLQDVSPAALDAYDKVSYRIRDIIKGLRPAMLNYGLAPALEALVDELNDRLEDTPHLVTRLSQTNIRYPERLELYSFRIIQQACNNAIKHADCKTIRISGDLSEEKIELFVEDDGKGFEIKGQIDLPALLEHKHFGLAGMFERAALIGAELQIISQPGQGCRVGLSWLKR
jgi:signal transduction histidine kinase